MLSKLEQFALAVLEQSRADWLGDVEGGWLQDRAEELGLLVPQDVIEPCGEACQCEYFPNVCLRYSPAVQAKIDGAKP